MIPPRCNNPASFGKGAAPAESFNTVIQTQGLEPWQHHHDPTASGEFVIKELSPISQNGRQRGIGGRIFRVRGGVDHEVAERIQFADCSG
jgi:hypothetical protein